MKNKELVVYSIVLNHHQAPVADCLYRLLGDGFCFVELLNLNENKGSVESFSDRPYLLTAWSTPENYAAAMRLSETADVCIFSGVQSLPFEKNRMKKGLLSFEMSERLLKRGFYHIISPRVFRLVMSYHLGGWRCKPLYSLCCSAYAAHDYRRLGMFPNKCYKWGYFTKVDGDFEVEAPELGASTSEITPLMWCARFLKLKHPEFPVLLAERLKKDGLSFVIDMYGDGELKSHIQELVEKKGLTDCVHLHGNKPNNIILDEMRKHSIFLFTSNRIEGWGAVANEAMSNKCCLVGANCIGSIPYLVQDGATGMIYQNGSVDSLYSKVKYLIEHPEDRKRMAEAGYLSIKNTWRPETASRNLLHLIDDIKKGNDSSIEYGPCSKA